MRLDNFKCKKCGECCRWDGFVHITKDDLAQLLDFLKIDVAEFMDKYVRPDRTYSITLKERPSKECIFLNGDVCAVYESRPEQCASFPHRWRTPAANTLCPAMKALPPAEFA